MRYRASGKLVRECKWLPRLKATMRRRDVLVAAGASVWAPAPVMAQSRARVLRFVPEGDLANPDPVWAINRITRNHAYLIWDTLYGSTGAGVLVPQMAVGHEVSADRLTWRVTLRVGLLFHDGTPVLARDCVPSLQRWARRRGLGQKLLSQLDEMRVLDDRRFEIRLKRPFPQLLTALADAFMMPERLARTDPYTQITEYVGSGPFRFERDEWVAGARAVYARNPGYQPSAGPADFTSGGKIVHFDRVEWIVMPDNSSAQDALARGEVDWWQNPQVEMLPTLRETPGVEVKLNDRIGAIVLMGFNHLQPPFNNPKLLRALLPAVDQTEFMQAAWGNEPALFRTGVGVFTPGTPMASDAGLEILTAPRDVERATRLVADSGYAGERVVLMSPTDYPDLQAVTQVANDLFQRVGLIVEHVGMEWATLLQRRASREPVEQGGWSAFCTTYEGLSVATPAGHLPLRGNGTDGWFGWPSSPRIEALRDAWFDAPDPQSQRLICEAIQRAAFEEVPYVPLGQRFSPTAIRTGLQGIPKAPFPIFWGVRRSG